MTEQTPKKRGRPPSVIEPVQLRKVAMLQCTIEEAASFLGVCERTLHRRLREDPDCQAAWEAGREFGKISLRRLMWKHANGTGSSATNMAIHLSKHWLGMSDKALVELAGKKGSPVEVDWSTKLHVLTTPELEQLETLMTKMAEAPDRPNDRPSS